MLQVNAQLNSIKILETTKTNNNKKFRNHNSVHLVLSLYDSSFFSILIIF